VAGWLVAAHESHELAGRLLTQSMAKQDVAPGTLTGVARKRWSGMDSPAIVIGAPDVGFIAQYAADRRNASDRFASG
jgi:hypothetical protein